GTVRLAELTRDARPLLVDLTEDGTLDKELSGRDGRVTAATGRCGDAPATALLLRPDCFVAWASSSSHPDAAERADLRAALTRWFGAAD
ncbi:MAG: FAD-dependent monooxygenase, partial [Streptosporangiales bacterium]